MNIGDKVRHKLSGQEMTIIKQSECKVISVCEIENEPLEWSQFQQKNLKPRAVCATENFELLDKQLTLF